VTPDAWVGRHPYLAPLASFAKRVEDAAVRLEPARAAIPRWDDYAADFRAGVPLLRSAEAAVEFGPAGAMAVALVEKLSSSDVPQERAAEAAALHEELIREPDAARRVALWLLGDDGFAPSSPGLLRYVGWTAAARYLAPLVEAFGTWRGESEWLRRHCPTCGSLPAMAQLVGADQGRRRLLSCGCCRSRWGYPRTACPFCERDVQRLGVVTVEGEAGLRIDYCESCRGYLKTYDGQGDETLMLSDWSSLHLDLLARDRGLQRLAVSLYEFPPPPGP
jgi:FdhE protein